MLFSKIVLHFKFFLTLLLSLCIIIFLRHFILLCSKVWCILPYMHLLINYIQIWSYDIVLSTTVSIRWDILMNWIVVWIVRGWLLLLHREILFVSGILRIQIFLNWVAFYVYVLVLKRCLFIASSYAWICVHHSINKIWRLDTFQTLVFIIW